MSLKTVLPWLALPALLAGVLLWPDVSEFYQQQRAARSTPGQTEVSTAFALPPNHGQTYAAWRQQQPQAAINLFAADSAPLLHAIQNSLYQIPAYRGQQLQVVQQINFSEQQVEITLEAADNPTVRDTYRWQADTGWKFKQPERLRRDADQDRRVPLSSISFVLVPALYADARQHNAGLYQERIHRVVFQAGTKRSITRIVGTTHVGTGDPTLWIVRLVDDRRTHTVFYYPDGRLEGVDQSR